MTPSPHDPHQGQPVLLGGVPIADARLVAILLHGRWVSADDILGLSREFGVPDVAYLAPEASAHTWYPYSFLAPLPQNEPGLGSALRVISTLIDDVNAKGISSDRVVLMGFSQGTCLALEFAARHARRYGAVVALSGGMIGPPGTPRAYAGSLDGTPVFIGCSDVDAHIPLERVRESAAVLGGMGAVVDERIYPGMGHTVCQDELDAVSRLLEPRP